MSCSLIWPEESMNTGMKYMTGWVPLKHTGGKIRNLKLKEKENALKILNFDNKINRYHRINGGFIVFIIKIIHKQTFLIILLF